MGEATETGNEQALRRASRRRHRRLAAFLLAVLLLNPPVLVVVDAIALPGGLPLTPAYLFLAWLALIPAAAWARAD